MNISSNMRLLTALTGAAATALMVTACEDRSAKNTTTTPAPSNTTTTTTTTPSTSASHDADNSGKNRRDNGTTAPTSDQAGQTQSDVNIAADIRKSIMAEKGMSVNGQNCKIIVNAGAVTLRGPVDSQSEKDLIESKAKAVAGVGSVTNELEVKIK